jgi:hypothetical protein
MEFSKGESIGSIYLSNLNIISSNLREVPVFPIISLKSLKIIKSFLTVAPSLKPSLGESLFKSYKS